MPVTVLFCEGKADTRLLRMLLSGLNPIVTVEPSGGKYGLGNRIHSARDARPETTVAGLRDRDFDEDDSTPTGIPRVWLVEGGRVSLGWYWERKEVENYLIDPLVVAKALGDKAPQSETYRRTLDATAKMIAFYTAARMSLAVSRPRFSPLPDSWGKERGREEHLFLMIYLKKAVARPFRKSLKRTSKNKWYSLMRCWKNMGGFFQLVILAGYVFNIT
jgi:hypothetical protein